MNYAEKLDGVASLLEDLSDFEPPQRSEGKPVQIPLDLIEEDPQQPRKQFDEGSLEELAASIRQRGVLQPVIIRALNQDGRHFLMLGARRFRAARLAGLSAMPAIIVPATPHDPYDQMIENIQRDDLTAAEIAEFVTSRLRAGETQKEIAERMGKTKGYVALYASTAEMASALRKRLATSPIRAVYDLHQVWKKDPQAAEAFCVDHVSFTRADVEALVAQVRASPADTENHSRNPKTNDRGTQQGNVREVEVREHSRRVPAEAKTESDGTQSPVGCITLEVNYRRRPGRLRLDLMSSKGSSFGVVTIDGGKDIDVPLSKLSLVALTAGNYGDRTVDTGQPASGFSTPQGRSAAEQPEAERADQDAL